MTKQQKPIKVKDEKQNEEEEIYQLKARYSTVNVNEERRLVMNKTITCQRIYRKMSQTSDDQQKKV